ncbi:MAG: hypothetical protein L6Q40_07345 [Azonexus sp.]|nr:hypothetical protein [Azonexus sp.]
MAQCDALLDFYLHPMKFTLYAIVLVAAALIVPFLIPGAGKQEGVDPNANLPWQIAVDGQGGSRVFGLELGRSTLAEAKKVFGSDVQVAIIANPDETGALEAYFNQVPLGFVLARVIVTMEIDATEVAAMRERAVRASYMESTTRKITLHPDDLALVEQLPMRAISLIPTVNLDEPTVIHRFGSPGERLAVSDKRVHLLYPERGLDIIIDGEGKELLQYVAPRNFFLLRDPLRPSEAEKVSGR